MKLKNGFTLFEIILVLFLTGAVTGLGVLSLSRLQMMFALRSSADEIKAQLQYGREMAIANKGNATYSYTLSGKLFTLTANGGEVSRFQLPPNVTVTPSSFVMTYSPVTGEIPTCNPCQILLSGTGNQEVVSIQANGIVN